MLNYVHAYFPQFFKNYWHFLLLLLHGIRVSVFSMRLISYTLINDGMKERKLVSLLSLWMIALYDKPYILYISFLVIVSDKNNHQLILHNVTKNCYWVSVSHVFHASSLHRGTTEMVIWLLRKWRWVMDRWANGKGFSSSDFPMLWTIIIYNTNFLTRFFCIVAIFDCLLVDSPIYDYSLLIYTIHAIRQTGLISRR